jgi:hypothetical protein
MFCPSCGKEITQTAQFCSFCGARVANTKSSQTMPSEMKKNPGKSASVFVLVVGSVSAVIQALIKGTGSLPDILAQSIGSLFFVCFLTLLVGYIPYLIFRSKIKNAAIIIYGVVSILLGVLSTIGSLIST